MAASTQLSLVRGEDVDVDVASYPLMLHSSEFSDTYGVVTTISSSALVIASHLSAQRISLASSERWRVAQSLHVERRR